MDEAQTAQLIPKAIVYGQPLLEFPEDLYIPPEALEVFLESFEGPLDLLLYLIRKQNIDILDIPIAAITQQYIEYMHLMKNLKLELAADYLVMAAMLAEIKSRLLLPKPPASENAEEQDPRAELVRRLQIYEQMKKAAEDLSGLPQLDKEFYWTQVECDKKNSVQPLAKIELKELILAMQEVLARCDLRKNHAIRLETISVRERMSDILSKLEAQSFLSFTHCFKAEEGRVGIVATFIALLELLKEGHIKIIQEELFGSISLTHADHV